MACHDLQTDLGRRACGVLSIETESVRAQIGRERSTLGLGGLPRLLSRPAVEGCFTKFGVGALLFPGDGVTRIPPPVVVVDRFRKCCVIIAVEMRRRATRQSQTDIAFRARIAET